MDEMKSKQPDGGVEPGSEPATITPPRRSRRRAALGYLGAAITILLASSSVLARADAPDALPLSILGMAVLAVITLVKMVTKRPIWPALLVILIVLSGATPVVIYMHRDRFTVGCPAVAKVGESVDLAVSAVGSHFRVRDLRRTTWSQTGSAQGLFQSFRLLQSGDYQGPDYDWVPAMAEYPFQGLAKGEARQAQAGPLAMEVPILGFYHIGEHVISFRGTQPGLVTISVEGQLVLKYLGSDWTHLVVGDTQLVGGQCEIRIDPADRP